MQAQDMQDPRHTGIVREFLLHLASGGMSGVVSKTLVAPVERVKLLLQLQHVSEQLKEQQRYRGIVDCVQRVYREQGLLSFWRGNMANVFRFFPTQAFNLAFKDMFKKLFVGNTTSDEFWRFCLGNLASGGAAGASTLLLLYPLDLARTRLAADVGTKESRQFKGIVDCIVKVYKQDGIAGLYQGFGVALAGIVLFRACYLGGYDIAKGTYQIKTFWERWTVAQGVTTVVGTLVYPLDTMRRRMMMQAGRLDGKIIYKNGWHCFQTIYKQEGPSGFYKGLGANVIRGVGGALLLVLYDEFNNVLK